MILEAKKRRDAGESLCCPVWMQRRGALPHAERYHHRPALPGRQLVHKFDPRMKLVLTIVYIILLFAASNPLGLTLSLVFLVAMYGVAKIPFKLITKSLKPILPIILFTAVLNLFFVSGERASRWCTSGCLNIYAEGLRYAILMRCA